MAPPTARPPDLMAAARCLDTAPVATSWSSAAVHPPPPHTPEPELSPGGSDWGGVLFRSGCCFTTIKLFIQQNR